MVEYRSSAHAIHDIKYHVVWITKYRYKVMRGRIAERVRDLLRETCSSRDVVIVRGAVSPDHIHMLLSVPPQLAPAKLVQYLKGRSSRRLQDEFEELRGSTCGREGYFYATVGEATIQRSPRRPSLEPGRLEAALAAPDRDSNRVSILPASAGSGFNVNDFRRLNVWV